MRLYSTAPERFINRCLAFEVLQRMQFFRGFSSTVLQGLSSSVPKTGFGHLIFIFFQTLLDDNPALLSYFFSFNKRFISCCLQAVISGAEPVLERSLAVLYRISSSVSSVIVAVVLRRSSAVW